MPNYSCLLGGVSCFSGGPCLHVRIKSSNSSSHCCCTLSSTLICQKLQLSIHVGAAPHQPPSGPLFECPAMTFHLPPHLPKTKPGARAIQNACMAGLCSGRSKRISLYCGGCETGCPRFEKLRFGNSFYLSNTAASAHEEMGIDVVPQVQRILPTVGKLWLSRWLVCLPCSPIVLTLASNVLYFVVLRCVRDQKGGRTQRE